MDESKQDNDIREWTISEEGKICAIIQSLFNLQWYAITSVTCSFWQLLIPNKLCSSLGRRGQ